MFLKDILIFPSLRFIIVPDNCYGIKCLRFPLNMPLVKATIAKFTQHSTTV